MLAAHTRSLCAIAALIAVSATHAAESAKPPASPTFAEKAVPFSDDAPKDASLFAFRNDLLKAVRAKDVKGLVGALDPTIMNGFDGQEGIEAFRTKWKLDTDPSASPVWKELGEVLRLGGTIERKANEIEFTAPYVYGALPDEFDEFEYGIVVGEAVNVRAAPDASSAAVQKVGRIVVRLYPEGPAKETTIDGETFPWRKVGLPNGATGYIWGKYVRSPLDYRAGFSNQSGQWKMTFFLAGD